MRYSNSLTSVRKRSFITGGSDIWWGLRFFALKRVVEVIFHLKMRCSSFFYSLKGIEHVPNIFMSFDKYLFLEVINIFI